MTDESIQNSTKHLPLTDVIIREARADDAEALLAYLKVIGSESDNLTFGEEGLAIGVEGEKAYLEEMHKKKTSVSLVACKDDKIIGDGSITALPLRMSHRAELGISVIQPFWNCGVGTMLLKKLIAYAKENGIELLNLEVRTDNAPAIHLYEKFGFKRIGISPAYMKKDDRYYDCLVMYLDLRG